LDFEGHTLLLDTGHYGVVGRVGLEMEDWRTGRVLITKNLLIKEGGVARARSLRLQLDFLRAALPAVRAE
jgi:hypothetical protein